jgi:biotin transporter BioY
MWTKTKSAILSQVCTRVLIGIIIAAIIILPFLTKGFLGYYYGASLESRILNEGLPFTALHIAYICAYACFVFALIALFNLDRLLRNIRLDQVFLPENVKILRIISWCCFAIAIIMICGWPFIHYVLLYVAAAAAFFGLLMRVVKNVIDAACELKAENDYTI